MREAGKYLIINPGRPGRRELKKAPRRKVKRNPGNDELLQQIKFIETKLKHNEISDSGRRLIRSCLIDIGSVLSRDLA